MAVSNAMLQGKKGMFLTFISIAIIAATIVIFTPSDLDLKKDMPVIKTRVANVNEYVSDLENVSLERTLQATGRKTFIGLIDYVKTNGFFPSEAEFKNAFSQALLSGEYNGNPINGMAGNTYNDWLNKIKNNAKTTLNVDTSFTVSNVQVYQIKPWAVNVDADVSFDVLSESASWSKAITVKTEISVEDFNDPYYLVKSNGAYANRIRQSGTKFNEWNVEKAKDFIRDGNYTHWKNSQAPNFIMRFTNTILPSSCCGIESLVNPNKPSITDKDVSYADYRYWSATPICPNSDLYAINGISNGEFPNFKLDFDHVVKYNLVSGAALECPPP